MRKYPQPFWSKLLCRIGWHKALGVTVGGYIRCYACEMNYDEAQGLWLNNTEFAETMFRLARAQQGIDPEARP